MKPVRAGTWTTPRWEVVVRDGHREVARVTVFAHTAERAVAHAKSIHGTGYSYTPLVVPEGNRG